VELDPRPKAREGLLTHDHSKRGRRYVTVVDPKTKSVALLEPWEHAILILCDGTRSARQILEVLTEPIEGESVDLRSVRRCLDDFEARGLIEPLAQRRKDGMAPAGPRTLADLQQAYREWHKDPVKTGQILSGMMPIPFPEPQGVQVPVGLEPTVALPEDEEPPRPPVKIGTSLVFGGTEGSFDAQSIRSVLDGKPAARDRRPEPETLVGALAGEGASVATGEFEEDELELGGNVSELLAAVDDEVREVEAREAAAKEKKKPPPVGKPIGGVADVPRAKSVPKAATNVWLSDVPEKPATRVITSLEAESAPKIPRAPALPPSDDEDNRDEPTMRSIPYGEAALRPTIVGAPPDKGTEPVILSPMRPQSKAMARIGAVIGPEPLLPARNVIDAPRRVRRESDIRPGSTIEDYMGADAATEAAVETAAPRDVDSRVATDGRREEDTTTSSSGEHVRSDAAREVFELLRRAGLKARSYADESVDPKDGKKRSRRRDDAGARRFEQALVSLTAGDLELALAHFRALLDRAPDSKRVRAFVDAIELVRSDKGAKVTLLEDFEAALEDAIAYGRCPRCMSMMAADQPKCFACGFALEVS
jgi:hypothetical protein